MASQNFTRLHMTQGQTSQNFTRRLEAIKAATGKRWEEIAESLGVTREHLYNYRKGKHGPPPHIVMRLEATEREAGLSLPSASPKNHLDLGEREALEGVPGDMGSAFQNLYYENLKKTVFGLIERAEELGEEVLKNGADSEEARNIARALMGTASNAEHEWRRTFEAVELLNREKKPDTRAEGDEE